MFLTELNKYCSLKNSLKLTLLNNYFNSNIKINSWNSTTSKNIYNKKIKDMEKLSLCYDVDNINHMINLKEVTFCSSIFMNMNQNGIKKLTKITLFDSGDNEEINNVNHLRKLRHLMCYFDGITQYGIRKLTKITLLNCSINKKIYNINHLTNLKDLNCTICTIHDDGVIKKSKILTSGINKLKKIIKICGYNIKKITVKDFCYAYIGGIV